MEERFWKKVDKSGDCWLWTGVTSHGYGYTYSNKQGLRAHRVSWELCKGLIPKGICVCHHCDNPSCVNPDHLFLGTHKDNTKDMVVKGRCGNPGAKLTLIQIHEIRERVENNETQRSLAKEFGVTQQTISCIVTRKTWKNIK